LNSLNLKEELKGLARERGLKAAIAAVRPAPRLEALLKGRRQKGAECPFTAGTPEERARAGNFLPGARSVLAVALPYPAASDPPWAARFARGEDYHRVLQAKITELERLLKAYRPAALSRVAVDTAPVVDRFWARRAGLGWWGKNSSLVSGEAGSFVCLGELFTDQELEPDQPLKNRCGHCTRCLEACPTGALLKPGVINYRRCLSYWTQAPGLVPREIRPHLTNTIYGCDLCQEACPYNRRVLTPSSPVNNDDLAGILQLSNRAFQQRYRNSAFTWRGPAVLKRNAIIALGNSGQPAAAELLLPYLNHANPMLRAHAAAGVLNLGHLEGHEAVRQLSRKESHPLVLAELNSART